MHAIYHPSPFVDELDLDTLRFPSIPSTIDLDNPNWAWAPEMRAEYEKRQTAVAVVRQSILYEREWAIAYMSLRESLIDIEGNITDKSKYDDAVNKLTKNLSVKSKTQTQLPRGRKDTAPGQRKPRRTT